ncbi:hypothetical protein R9X47_24240 [Wukongibacter baidiensis]|uniref:hypothetical protein n=1 Tax=Wukongibacter baidiensis TaxID=1723361 RepID=UPI003D7F8830
MGKILIVTSYRRILAILILLILVGILTYLLLMHIGFWNAIQVSEFLGNEETEELAKENSRLRDMLKGILPKDQRVLYENPYRLYRDQTVTVESTSLKKVIESGKDIPFKVSYKIPEYLRPIYDPMWAAAYYRGWVDLEYKVKEAQHRLFVFPLGLSSRYDFTGSLGFDGSPSVDVHRNINFLIYHFDVEEVKQLGNQIAIVGRPKRRGVEVIAVNKDDLFPKGEGKGSFLIQLSTTGGYEVDFIYEKHVMKYEDLMKHIQEHTVKASPTATSLKEELTLEELKNENKVLREELSKYIPIEDKEIITEKKCRPWPGFYKVGKTFSIDSACENSAEIQYKILYQNKKYRRPIYHPAWKENVQKGWSYIPDKICENLHTLFSIPRDPHKQSDLLGKLGFFEKYSPIHKNEVGFLIYNFEVDKVIKYNNQIIFMGVPSRTGAEIISIDDSSILNIKNYLVQLSTPNCIEIDYDILTAE